MGCIRKQSLDRLFENGCLNQDVLAEISVSMVIYLVLFIALQISPSRRGDDILISVSGGRTLFMGKNKEERPNAKSWAQSYETSTTCNYQKLGGLGWIGRGDDSWRRDAHRAFDRVRPLIARRSPSTPLSR
jgi:hypothetical protein